MFDEESGEGAVSETKMKRQLASDCAVSLLQYLGGMVKKRINGSRTLYMAIKAEVQAKKYASIKNMHRHFEDQAIKFDTYDEEACEMTDALLGRLEAVEACIEKHLLGIDVDYQQHEMMEIFYEVVDLDFDEGGFVKKYGKAQSS
jgi:hypothetical protein